MATICECMKWNLQINFCYRC